jgi:hypothetical protein
VKIGLGLPNADKSLSTGRLLVDIAHRAEALGFSSLATMMDRVNSAWKSAGRGGR